MNLTGKLTQRQDTEATALRDAGVPGDWAVLAASRADDDHKLFTGKNSRKDGPDYFSDWLWRAFVWTESPEGHDFWRSVVHAANSEEQK